MKGTKRYPRSMSDPDTDGPDTDGPEPAEPARTPASAPSGRAPAEVRELAHARSDARRARDWARADVLRMEIEAAGWKVVDNGFDFRLVPAHPPDVIDGGRVRYGSPGAVPSRLDEPATGPATVVLPATDWPDDLARAIRALEEHAAEGTSIVILANGPGEAQEAALVALEAEPAPRLQREIVWLSAGLGFAAALNAAIRRAAGRVVVVMDSSLEAVGDPVAPLVVALEDPGVGVAGGFGISTADFRRREDAEPGEVDAVEIDAMAFRRADFAARGPLDERFHFHGNLDIWWSLVLRDEGDGVTPRRAVAVTLPLVRHERRDWTTIDAAERNRLARRNYYRVIDRFGKRHDLARGSRRGD